MCWLVGAFVFFCILGINNKLYTSPLALGLFSQVLAPSVTLLLLPTLVLVILGL